MRYPAGTANRSGPGSPRRNFVNRKLVSPVIGSLTLLITMIPSSGEYHASEENVSGLSFPICPAATPAVTVEPDAVTPSTIWSPRDAASVLAVWASAALRADNIDLTDSLATFVAASWELQVWVPAAIPRPDAAIGIGC